MKKLAFYILLILCATSCTRCKKDKAFEPATYPNYTPTQPIKDYAIFKPGTFWVYQDSATGVLDSVWVYQYSQTTDTVQKPANTYNICPVYLYRTFSSKYHSNNYVEFNTGFEILNGSNMILESVIDSASYIGDYVKLHSPLVEGKTMSYITDDDCTFMKKYSSYTFNSIVYNNVLKYHHSRDMSSYYFINYQHHENKTQVYYAPNIGIIRKEIIDSNKVWNLIRYNIVQ